MIANSERQLIIESHSDHVFNGIRVGIHNKKIDTKDVSINFFTLNDNNLSNHTLVEISENGRIINEKDYLFDQFDNDVNALLDIY